MIESTPLKDIENFVAEIAAQSGTIFPVEIKVSPANDIKVFIDADDGVTVEKCTKINRALYKHIEEAGLFPGGNFSLEVSSPGIDEPLKLYRQYKKNIGRRVEVLMIDGSKTEGKLLSVNDDKIDIEDKSGKGNKTAIKTTTILFNQIKQTKVLITF